MQIFKKLLNCNGSKLNQLETLLLAELRRRLEPPAALLIARQIEQLNLVQRHSRSREVCCYSMKDGKPFHDHRNRFPDRTSELRFATINFRQALTERS